MDHIKEAFQKVKQDIDSLYDELNNLKSGMKETREEMIKIVDVLNQISDKITLKQPEKASTQEPLKSATSTHPSTHNYPLEPLKSQNMGISTGNQGVPTDRQTDRQTHNKPQNEPKIIEKIDDNTLDSIDNAAKILDSLDSIKKDIRLKFKRLTEQEILVFSTLYQIDEETGPTDYKTLADKLGLTESSIRDYIGRLIKKGIPVEKKRINNKMIQLSVSQNLKKIASLSTILQLRDI
jgi:DNA-binding MarR family transcriptional regulator